MDDDNKKNDLTDLNDISDFLHDESDNSELSDLSDSFLENDDDNLSDSTGTAFDPSGVHDFSEQSFNQLSEEEATSLIEIDQEDGFAHSSDEDTKFFTPGAELYDEEDNESPAEGTSQWNTICN